MSTDPNYPSYLDDCLTAVAQRLSLIADIPDIKVRTIFGRAPGDEKYVVCIAPETDAYGDVLGFLDPSQRRTGEIKYAIRVGILAQASNQYDRPDPRVLNLREQIRQRLDEPKLASASAIFDTDLELGAIFDAAATNQDYVSSSMTLTASSIEPLTGTNVSNQAG